MVAKVSATPVQQVFTKILEVSKIALTAQGETPLHKAVEQEDYEKALELLLEYESKSNFPFKDQISYLHQAVEAGDTVA